MILYKILYKKSYMLCCTLCTSFIINNNKSRDSNTVHVNKVMVSKQSMEVSFPTVYPSRTASERTSVKAQEPSILVCDRQDMNFVL
jgi:hypothetical protein